MNTYIITKAYPWTNTNEIEIESDNLNYHELQVLEDGKTMSGVQCVNMDNHEEIHKTCVSIANLFRRLDELNKHAPQHINKPQ